MVTLQLINENLSTLKKSELFNSVREWANARNLIKEGDTLTQEIKLYEELGELARGVVKEDLELIKDSIGDSIVVFINLLAIDSIAAEDLIKEIEPAYNPEIDDEVLNLPIKIVAADCFKIVSNFQYYEAFNNLLCCLAHICCLKGLTLVDCLQSAYDEIKNRKGKMVNGSFIKEE